MSSSSGIAPAIQQKYAEHSALLAQIASIDYIPHAYHSNKSRIEHIKKELEKREHNLHKLQHKTKSEFKDVQDLQKSSSKRFFIKLTKGGDGLEKQKEKEQQEYMAAFQAENNEKLAIRTMEDELAMAERAIKELKATADKREEAQKRLNQIYQELFGGLTAEYPEEDKAEEIVNKAELEYNDIQQQLFKQSQSNLWLIKAEKAVVKVLDRLQKAEDISMKELMSSNRGYEMYEIKDLQSAKKHALEAEMFVKEAKKLEPQVHELGSIKIPFEDDDAHTELDSKGNPQVHKMINHASKGAIKFQAKLELELSVSKERLEKISKVAITEGTSLAEKRSELEKIRRKIIEDVHKGVLPISTASTGPWVPGTNTFPVASPVESHSSSKNSNFPAGGFRSESGIIMPGQDLPTAPEISFPAAPAYQHPPIAMGPTTPGFRGAAEANVMASIVAVNFPSASPWAMNPMLMGVEDDDPNARDEDFKMPQIREQPTLNVLSTNAPLPDLSEPLPTPSVEVSAKWPVTELDEETLMEKYGKVMRMVDNPPRWEGSAPGPLKLLVNNRTKALHLLWSSTGSAENTIQETEIRTSMRSLPTFGIGGNFVWSILANDLLAIRFKTQDDATEFQRACERALASVSRASTPMSFNMPLSPVDVPSTSTSSTKPPGSSTQDPVKSLTESMKPMWISDVKTAPKE